MMTGRLGEDGLGDADALAVALGELADDLVADAFQVAELEHLVDARAEFAAGDFLQPAAKIQVFADAHVLGQRIVFRHVADLALRFVRLGGDRNAADADPARGGGQVAGEDAHGRGLAGAVRPEETEDFAARHGEADVVDRRDPGVGLDQMGDFDGG